MILEDATFEAFGYYPLELKPKSDKPILAICELCGEFRVLRRADYRTFCKSCSHFYGEKSKGNINALGSKRTDEQRALMSKNCPDQKVKGILCLAELVKSILSLVRSIRKSQKQI